MHGRTVHRWKARRDLNGADRVLRCQRPHRHHHRAVERTGCVRGNRGAVHRNVATQRDVPQLNDLPTRVLPRTKTNSRSQSSRDRRARIRAHRAARLPARHFPDAIARRSARISRSPPRSGSANHPAPTCRSLDTVRDLSWQKCENQRRVLSQDGDCLHIARRETGGRRAMSGATGKPRSEPSPVAGFSFGAGA